MRRYTIIIIIIGVILGFLTGLYLYKITKIDNENTDIIAEYIEDECTEIAELNENELLDLVRTNATEEKVSPNAYLVIKKYYSKCKHLIQTSQYIDNELVNLSKQEIREKYSDWEIQKFTEKKIVLYKEINDFCNEHYIIKEVNGYIAIYRIDQNNKEELIENTDISVKYLTDTDLDNIKNGLKIYTKQELNRFIEDFE